MQESIVAMEASTSQQANSTPSASALIFQPSNGTLPKIIVTPAPSIQASDTPKRSWNQAQCRLWIAAVLLDKDKTGTGESESEAKFWASRFRGDGEDMFRYGPNKWQGIVKSKIGLDIFHIIDGVKKRQRAMFKESARSTSSRLEVRGSWSGEALPRERAQRRRR